MLRVCLVLLFGAAAGVAALDAALAGARSAEAETSALIVDDLQTLWRNAPNFRDEWLSTDAYGMRNPGLPRDASKREIRVLGIGDSRVFGARDHGPTDDETWNAQLQPMLAGTLPEGVRVLNGGVGGYSMIQTSHHGARLLEVVEPDLILVFIAPGGRCLLDVTSTYSNIRVHGRLVPRDVAKSVPESFRVTAGVTHDWLADHSPLYAHWRRVKADLAGGLGALRTSFVFSGDADIAPGAQYLLAQTFAALRELADKAARAHCRVVAVLMYDSFAMDGGSWERFVATNVQAGGPKLGTKRQATIAALRESLKSVKIDTCWWIGDMQERFALNRREYFADEGKDWDHLSPIGNAMLAAKLAQEFEKSKILKELHESRLRHVRR